MDKVYLVMGVDYSCEHSALEVFSTRELANKFGNECVSKDFYKSYYVQCMTVLTKMIEPEAPY